MRRIANGRSGEGTDLYEIVRCPAWRLEQARHDRWPYLELVSAILSECIVGTYETVSTEYIVYDMEWTKRIFPVTAEFLAIWQFRCAAVVLALPC